MILFWIGEMGFVCLVLVVFSSKGKELKSNEPSLSLLLPILLYSNLMKGIELNECNKSKK